MALFYHGVLALAAGWHLLALAGMATATSGAVFCAMLATIAIAFVIAVRSHPRSTISGGGASVDIFDVMRALPGPLKLFGSTTVAYGVIATSVLILLARARLGTLRGHSPLDLGSPCISAFAVSFAALGWLVGVSGVHARQRRERP